MLKRPAILFACLLFAAVFLFGLVRLFELRYDRGDIYPPYSTLRTDPLGTSVLYEGLEKVPGVTPERYFDETLKIDDGHAHALFILGTEPYGLDSLPRSEYNTLQRFVFNGGRVVIAYYPEITKPWSERYPNTNETDSPVTDGKPVHHFHHPKPAPTADDNNGETNLTSDADSLAGTNEFSFTNGIVVIKSKPTAGPAQTHHTHKAHKPGNTNDDQGDQDDQELQTELQNYADLSTEWGFKFSYLSLDTNEDGEIQFPNAKMVARDLDLPAQIPVHTSLYFSNLTNGWAAIYQRDKTTPVVIERKFGAGSVVLVADSYPFSNEAMFKDRSAPLISWMLGGGHDAIFDEAHLGIMEQPGMATLMRRYQLHGLIFSLLLVAGLFVWKNSISLVPPYDEGKADAGLVVAGRDSASGFVNLVRRGIAPAEIINVCFAEWKKSGARVAALSPAQRRDVEQLIQQQATLEPNLRKPVENYRVITQILKRRT